MIFCDVSPRLLRLLFENQWYYLGFYLIFLNRFEILRIETELAKLGFGLIRNHQTVDPIHFFILNLFDSGLNRMVIKYACS